MVIFKRRLRWRNAVDVVYFRSLGFSLGLRSEKSALRDRVVLGVETTQRSDAVEAHSVRSTAPVQGQPHTQHHMALSPI